VIGNAPANCASEDPAIRYYQQRFTPPAEENYGAIRACAASNIPSTAGVTLDLFGQRLERVSPLGRVARQ
jgi:hypothetical protein